MSERNGTANLLAQVKAFRELKDDYSPEVAESLTSKNLQRNDVDASVTDVKGWAKINEAALQGRLDIPTEITIAEGKAAIAAGTAIDQLAAVSVVVDEQESAQDDAGDDQDDADSDEQDDNEVSTVDDLYGYDNPEDNEEAAFDDVLKIQENS
ncbi:hypothetical protein [Noviherbaspirillum sedimenti]|uniref:Uncharacterized protein n=1 Tax=Noviherbaspirillum sedimenti TaxID=2320865 RepID=A0A3A3G1F2_9BURK|nr:hypothetical protein [Noviherbaspirillum sedimenti]RJG02273.1 hypothetical protein D3878_12380 [Noviherbaspirillum sedimenti]